MPRSLTRTLQIYINAQREVDGLKDWASGVVSESRVRAAERRKLDYLRWKRQMELVKDAFERCSTQITAVPNGNTRIQFSSFDVLDQPTWETFQTGTDTANFWYFWMTFTHDTQRTKYCFYFATHLPSDAAPGVNEAGLSVSLVIDELLDDKVSTKPSEANNCSATLREILIVNEKVARKRYDAAENKDAYDLEVDPLQLAREFIEEVTLNRLT